ncbi:TetR/AcrR family transcriptional regulator [Pseudoxanthomonas beigongshangi]
MPSHPPSPDNPRSERGEAQRARILDASRTHFIQRGFHAASMGDIAAEAGISAGLIYRYFQSKREIIQAIIRQHLVESRLGLGGLPVDSALVDELVQAFRIWGDGDLTSWSPVLFAEVTAESARDADTAAILRESERGSRDEFITWLERRDHARGHHGTAEARATRALMMQLLVEGLIIRAAREPAFPEATIRDALEKMLPLVLDP